MDEGKACVMHGFQDSELEYVGGSGSGRTLTDTVEICECASCGSVVLRPPTLGYGMQMPFDEHSQWGLLNHCPHCGEGVREAGE